MIRASAPRCAVVALLAVMAGVAAAQDTTAPTVLSASATLELQTNAEPVGVRIAASANEASRFLVTARYRSSYPRFIDPVTAHYAYKTAAVGDHEAASLDFRTSISGLTVEVGPRCYHSDTLTVWVAAEDEAGNRSEPVEVLSEVIEMPLGDVPTPQPDGFGFTAFQQGGYYPSSATNEEWAEADVAICGPIDIWGSAGYEESRYHRWIAAARDVPGSRNAAVLGLTAMPALWNNSDVPVAQRAYRFFQRLYLDAQQAASPDTNVLAHLVDGTLARPQFSNWSVGTSLANLTYPVARDTLAWFLAMEWSHADNRVANVGLLFDVWEVCKDYPVIVNGVPVFGPSHLDHDLDGIPMVDDPDGQTRSRQARLAFIRALRRRIYLSAEDPAVGRYFLIGGNSVDARADAEMASLFDHIFVEDLQCPAGCSTGLPGFPWHFGLADHYERDYFPSYCQNDILGLPIPDGFSSDFANLAAAMRDSAGGPFLTPESIGACSGEMMDSAYNVVYGMLFDGLYPIWTDRDGSRRRIYSSPMRNGLPDLEPIGLAIGPRTHTLLPGGSHLWQRPYQYGWAEVILADESLFDCERGDQFEYRVIMNDWDAWKHPHWGEPAVETFFVTDWDSSGFGGTVRLDLTAIGSEPCYWERSVRVDGGAWQSTPMTDELTDGLSGFWDTGLQPAFASLDVRVRARDRVGLLSPWREWYVEIERFTHTVQIESSEVAGTAYGLAGQDGNYVVTGRGVLPPDAAPPHELDLTGTVEGGFVPVEVRWSNSLGGTGAGEVGAGWRITGIPLQRGLNVITVTCINAAGDAAVGTMEIQWDYPGRPQPLQ